MTTKFCLRCKQIKPLSDFYIRKSGSRAGKPIEHCKKCVCDKAREYREATGSPYKDPMRKAKKAKYDRVYRATHPEKQSKNGYYAAHREQRRAYTQSWNHRTGLCRPMNEAIDSSQYLGVYVAERALSGLFDHVERMPFGNPKFDFICGKGFKIDCKSACTQYSKRYDSPGQWHFNVNRNTIADYFLCLAFNNREALEPQHVWLIPGHAINDHVGFGISNTPRSLAKWSKYERPLDRVLARCSEMRSETA